jgi:DNA mismatch repair protein MutS
MRQHDRFKRAHPGCLLFFRMGDFYELFDEDAVTAHKALASVALRLTPTIPALRARTTRA